MNIVPSRKIDGADIPFIIGACILVGFIIFNMAASSPSTELGRATGEQAILIIIAQSFVAVSSVVFFSCASYFRLKELKPEKSSFNLFSLIEIVAPAIVSLFLYFIYWP